MMKILYICTHNRCRSILAEALSNHHGGGLLLARSAGSQPAGAVHPGTLAALQAAGVPTEGLRSESWEAYADFAPDLVLTLCDSAAGESCPLWMGRSLKLHWGLADPSRSSGAQPQAAAFAATVAAIEERVRALRAVASGPRVDWPAALRALVARDLPA